MDTIIAARLLAVAKRRAGWRRPEGREREDAVAELQGVATVTERSRRGSPHPPKSVVRFDLMAEVAGILRGGAVGADREQRLIAAELLIDAGADPEEVEKWVPEGLRRALGGGAPFSRPAGRGAPRPGSRA
ncbi:hypothetical protein SMC26_25335 [Actinomadura fulvescens]|uniref:Uncharacterized protein n=1 Tax=Actinomadura fulvescens TaxID=46160 RepID=A0ABN3Q3D9_9ACTN